MATANLEGGMRPIGRDSNESSVSAVSWAAIAAGTVVAVAATIILMALGSGIGFASMSPWPSRGVSATTFTVMTAVWLIVVQWGSSALGGYTTGRLRTKWTGVHTHEVFFRDTAHGLVTWATATVFGALLFAVAAMHTAGRGVQAAASVTAAAAEHAPEAMEHGAHGMPGGEAMGGYEMDKLFRSNSPEPVAPERYHEVARIMHNAMTSDSLSPEDRSYLSHMVASRGGVSEQEAQKRVDDTLAEMKAAELKARQAADAARRAAAEASIYTALSMLVGAFIACAAAALGGRLRDEHL